MGGLEALEEFHVCMKNSELCFCLFSEIGVKNPIQIAKELALDQSKYDDVLVSPMYGETIRNFS